MIEFEQVSFTYDGAAVSTLAGLDLRVADGELCLLVGATGTGKSTLLRLVNGLAPHFTGGTLAGRVRVEGRDTREHPPRELADVVGYVGQNPAAGFVTSRVEDELAYTMESLGLPRAVMRRRIEDTLDLLGLVDVRDRPPQDLSGGQQQRVAIAAVLTANPMTLVLDEPTSALDPQSAEDVLATLTRLVHDLGITVLVAEHRLERVLGYADTMIWLPAVGAAPKTGPAAEVAALCPLCPPVVELARRAGWRPPPLTVRDARTRAVGLRDRLAARPAAPTATSQPGEVQPVDPVGGTDDLTIRRGTRTAPVTAVRDLTLRLRPGRVCAVMGRNGSGKSTLLESLAGLHEADTGHAWLADAGATTVGAGTPADPRKLRPTELIRHVGLVPQQPADLLYLSTVAAECAAADRGAGAAAGTCAGLLTDLAGDLPPGRHPRDLSEGQRLGLALAIVLTAAPPLLLLDEPTRGLDYPAKHRLAAALRAQAAAGRAVCFASHDVELVAAVAAEVVLLAHGEVVDAGPTATVVTASPVFAPQMAKVFRPTPVLTVDEVAAALGLPASDQVAGGVTR